MKQALLIGCGNERGERIINGCNEAGYQVTNIGSSVYAKESVTSIQTKWEELDIIALHKILKTIDHKVDFVFFNQNASSLSQDDFVKPKDTLDTWGLIKGWSKSYWLSCQLPYFVVQTLGDKLDTQSVIGWMLSSFIDFEKDGVDDHPDYSGYKFTNYLIMKNFTNKFKCFGINPDFSESDKMKNLIRDILSGAIEPKGEIFGFDKNTKSKYNNKKET